jgi:eukaryotic-like serine/threonine-protein kinase
MTSSIHRNPQHPTDGPEPTLRYGDTFGEYLINGFAGKGATSYVYEARPRDSFERVAIKVLHPHLLADPEKRRKFYREARIMMRMRHPNVVRFERVLEIDGHLAYVMEYIDGMTLERWLAEEAQQADQLELACLFTDILRGLTHAHRHGVVHRDMKPANILITAEQGRYVAKIIDFGLARFADQPLSQKERAKIAGTAAYISPEEVVDPDAVGLSSDLYSLGVMLYEAACGRRPFDAECPRELLEAHAHSDPVRPRELNPEISEGFEEVIMRTLSKQPDRRFGSAPEMIGAMETAINEAMRSQMEEAALESAPTTEWSRSEQMSPAARKHALMMYLMVCMRAMFSVLASTGASTREDDPHYMNRSHDQNFNLPM